ncbi:MAG TPA: phage tail protein, partial [Acidocella sp.]|nr:phage tail protein [Acidocella sp.]
MITPLGLLNTTALTVPGLYVQIVPPPIAINGVASNVLGIVGTSTWGPVNVATVIGTPGEYQQSFGPQQNRSYDLGTAVSIAAMQGASAFKCVRVTDGTDMAATVEVATNCITFTARYTGTLGNAITVALAAAPVSGNFNVTVSLPAIGYAQTFPNITGTGAAFWTALANAINNGIPGTLVGPSPVISAVAGAGTTSPTAETFTLTGGTDGVTSVTGTTLEGADTAPRTGMYALRSQGCGVVMLADNALTSTFTNQEAFGLSEGAYMVATMPASVGTPSSTISTQQAALLAAGASSYALKVMFGDWVYWYDTVNQITRLVSPQAFAAGRLAALAPNESACNKPVYGVVGTQQSGLPGSTQAQSYADADLQAIFGSGSAPSFDLIMNPIPAGAMWGIAGGFNTSATPGIDDDSYTRMTNYIAVTLNAAMGKFVGQTITPALLSSISATLSNFLSGLLN